MYVADLGQDCEGFWIQDIDFLVLCAHHQAADCIILYMALLHGGHAGDDCLQETNEVTGSLSLSLFPLPPIQACPSMGRA